MTTRVDTVVIGAGVSGLSCATRLRSQGISVTVIEKSERAGGVIQNAAEDGFLYELGPNSTLDGKPALRELIEQLDLTAQVVEAAPSSRNRYVVRDGRLCPLPLSPPDIFKSPLFGVSARIRLLAEAMVPGRRWNDGDDETVASFFKRRFGQDVVDYAVNPFVAGVYAGDPEQLSVVSAFPAVVEFEREHGSVLKGAVKSMKKRKAAGGTAARMLTFMRGMAQLTDAMAAYLGDDLRLACEVLSVQPTGGGWQVTVRSSRGEMELVTRALILALPAGPAASLVEPFEPDLAAKFARVPYAPIAIVHVDCPDEICGMTMDGFGFLVPAVEQRKILGAIFSSSLFPGRAPEGHNLLTVFLGGLRSPELAASDDETLKSMVTDELKMLLELKGEPVVRRITRWQQAIPQYSLGHGLLDAAVKEAEQRRGLYVSSNVSGGISVGDCVASGFDVADRVARRVHYGHESERNSL